VPGGRFAAGCELPSPLGRCAKRWGPSGRIAGRSGKQL